jgi:hypothetical protein
MTTANGALSRNPTVKWRRLGEESVLLDVTTETYYALNEVGTRAWELIDGRATEAEIAVRIASEYDAPLRVVEADVRTLLGDLRDQNLLL